MPLYRQFADALRAQSATNVEIWLTLSIVLGVILFFSLRSLWLTKGFEIRKRTDTFQRFIAACRHRALSPEETEFLRTNALALGYAVNSSLVQSNAVFDKLAGEVMQRAAQEEIGQYNTEIKALRHRLGFKPPPRELPLSSTRELPVGQLIYVIISSNLFLGARVSYSDELSLKVRLQDGYPRAELKPGMQVYLHLNRTGEARYSGPSNIIQTLSDEEGIYVHLNHCTELRRDQRRRDFRIEENRAIALWVMDEQLAEAGDPIAAIKERIPERAVLEDISGGGASIIFKRQLPAEQSIIINLDPSGSYDLPIARGAILRSERRGRTDRWAHSVRFEDLRPSEHQKIVNHVFLKERDLLKIA